MKNEIQDLKSRLEIVEMEKAEIDSKYESTFNQLNSLEMLLSPIYTTVKDFMSDLLPSSNSHALDMQLLQEFVEEMSESEG